MTNFGAKLIGSAISGISAHQALLANTGNNIANVNTPGYARRTLNVQTRSLGSSSSELNIGSGVDIGTLSRDVDSYLEKVLRGAIGEKQSSTVESDLLSRAENLFKLTPTGDTIGSRLTQFFNSLKDLSQNPASIELRSNVIEVANDLITTIQNTYSTIADLQTEADNRINTELEQVNGYLDDIARLNLLVAGREGSGNLAADERDQRDQIIKKLAEKISFNVIEGGDGMVSITVGNGLDLVTGGNTKHLDFTNAPSFAAGALPPSLGGGVLRYIVYDYSNGAGTAHVDLTSELANGDGTIGGLLRIRGVAATTQTSSFEADGALVDIASRVEGITRQLLTSFNSTYIGPDENGGLAGRQASSGDLDGNTPTVYGFFDFNFGGVKDADADGNPDDLTAVGLDNYSSVLQLAISDPRDIAAARDLNAAAGATSFAPGDSANLTALIALETTSATFAAGNFSQTGTFGEVYDQLVTRVGSLKSSAESLRSVAEDNYTTAANRRDEYSAVSLDEEFTKLIGYQKGFQASARVIQVYDKIFDQLVNLL